MLLEEKMAYLKMLEFSRTYFTAQISSSSVLAPVSSRARSALVAEESVNHFSARIDPVKLDQASPVLYCTLRNKTESIENVWSWAVVRDDE